MSQRAASCRRVKRLAIMDQDGANIRYLTNGDALVLNHGSLLTAQEITYLSYFNNTHACIFSISSGRQELLGNF